MTDLQRIILYSFFSGSTVFLGGVLAYYFGRHVKSGLIKTEIIHSSIAFGGGILFAAVGLVLIPEGISAVPLTPMILFFSAGVVLFFFIDRYLERRGGTLAQLLGMMLDFVPESIALGAVFASNTKLGVLLAIIIGIQNFPEAFNAYLDLKVTFTASKCLLIFFLLSFSGVISALTGYYFLSGMPMTIGALMLLSSGGLIYLIFQDIAPMSQLKKSRVPALGASLGFLVGMIGLKMLG
jgi:ZIP family zinc transporter